MHCVICNEAIENYVTINKILYCIDCYKSATNKKSLDEINEIIDSRLGDILQSTKQAIQDVAELKNTTTSEYVFTENRTHIIGKPFKLTDEEAEFFHWKGNVLILKQFGVKGYSKMYEFLQSKTSDSIKDAMIKVDTGYQQYQKNVQDYEFKRDDKLYNYSNLQYSLIGYFFGLSQFENKIDRGKKYFYIYGRPLCGSITEDFKFGCYNYELKYNKCDILDDFYTTQTTCQVRNPGAVCIELKCDLVLHRRIKVFKI